MDRSSVIYSMGSVILLFCYFCTTDLADFVFVVFVIVWTRKHEKNCMKIHRKSKKLYGTNTTVELNVQKTKKNYLIIYFCLLLSGFWL